MTYLNEAYKIFSDSGASRGDIGEFAKVIQRAKHLVMLQEYKREHPDTYAMRESDVHVSSERD